LRESILRRGSDGLTIGWRLWFLKINGARAI